MRRYLSQAREPCECRVHHGEARAPQAAAPWRVTRERDDCGTAQFVWSVYDVPANSRRGPQQWCARRDGATLIAVGRVIRFVPSSTASHRGYDLEIRRVFVGDPVESVIGLRVANEIQGIRRLSPVLVLAELSDTEPHVLTAGRCQALQIITEAEFIRWTESP
jgi:hypothetical protein